MASNSTPGTSATKATPNVPVPVVLPCAKPFPDVSNIEIFANENFKSTITCAYIALQLFRLSSQDSIYLVLFSNSNRQVCAPSV
ncbi:putative ATP synthase 24 kDa subunit, mitochondrial-like [Capsicum annuum]|uniref:Uncharacterized protein n=1 Tax=Capsicum annuum TaxID=4072 RepID=A0A2G2ZQ24_CAPAN|nr:putative ATP synthase 24 kDa subunit, mitochondrial-like [Capsicum annuum]PHT84083.1 hypothetical protein T459_12526 [Capsicum annuum]